MRMFTLPLLCLLFSVTASIASAQAPDLVANSISGPNSAQCGVPMNLTRDITNIGGPLAAPFSYSVWVSTNNVISPSDTQVGIFQSNTFGLVPITITLPNSLQPGFYFLGLVCNAAPGESNTGNNVIASISTFQLAPGGVPDLIANGVAGPGTANPGQTISITRDILNSGCALTAPFSYTVRASLDQTITTADPLLATFNSTTLGALAISASVPATLAPATYWIGLVVDPGVLETNLVNNVIVSVVPMVVASPIPTITGVLPNTGATTGGTMVTISGTNFTPGMTTVTFGGVPSNVVNVVSTTTLNCTTPAAPNGVPMTVAVDIQTPTGTATLPAAFSYGDPWPGSGEDLLLETGVNGIASTIAVKTALAGDSITMAISSPLGLSSSRPLLLLGQVYTTGGVPPLSPPGFPEFHLETQNLLVILNGANPTPFGPIVVPAIGQKLTLPFFYPGGLSGFTGRVQALAIDSMATNGFFRASNALEIVYP
ncbi:MAG: IPT/TIG domain-containing protein [Planctomycetes bacterium]|nr:IPT/TIG domain-containing protein [Planctomycetota bacterium]